MSGFTATPQAFPPAYLATLRRQILGCRHLAVNTLNRDFVGTRGFSVVFRRATIERAGREFPFFKPYLDRVLDPGCNSFYLNPLLLRAGSRVDPHIDRSLYGYCPTVDPPFSVSVLYVEVPPAMRGGRLVLARGKKHLGRVTPAEGTLVVFDGDLTHSVERMDTDGQRMSLVCEQYRLSEEEMEQVPEYVIESRAKRY